MGINTDTNIAAAATSTAADAAAADSATHICTTATAAAAAAAATTLPSYTILYCTHTIPSCYTILCCAAHAT